MRSFKNKVIDFAKNIQIRKKIIIINKLKSTKKARDMNNDSTTQNNDLYDCSYLNSIEEEEEHIKNLEASFSDYLERVDRQIENRNGSTESINNGEG